MTDLELYSQAKYVSNMPVMAADAGTRTVAYRVYAVLQNDEIALRRSLDALQFWALRAMMPIVIVTAAIPSPIFRVLMGPRWEGAGPLLRWLAWHGLIMTLFNNLKMFRLVRHEWSTLALALVAEIVSLIVMMTVGFAMIGIQGTAMAFAFSYLGGLLMMSRPSEDDGRWLIKFETVRAPLMAAAAAIAVGILFPSGGSVLNVATSAGVVLASYAAGSWGLERAVLRESFRNLKSLAFAR